MIRPGRRQEAVRDVLGVDAALDRVPLQMNLVLRELEPLPGRDLHLRPHDVDARDDLGDRVLHLDPRVHLHEVVRAVGREQPLDRPGRPVPGGPRGVHGDLPDAVAQLRAHGGRRRLFDELLVAPLDRAVALAEVDDVPVGVGQHLHLDVPRVLEIPLDVDRRVGEVRPALALGGLEALHGLVRRPDHLHALAAAAGGRLDQQRVADLLAERDDLRRGRDRVGRAGDDRDARRLHRAAGARLRAHQLDRGGRRPDPDEPRLLDRARETGVLRQEAVAGMDRLRARAGRGLEQLLHDEVGLGRRAAAEGERLVGIEGVLGRPVWVGVDGHGADAHVPQGPEHPQRDLSTIGYQDFGEHTPYSPCR